MNLLRRHDFSSLLSRQSQCPLHRLDSGIHCPEEHLHSPARHVTINTRQLMSYESLNILKKTSLNDTKNTHFKFVSIFFPLMVDNITNNSQLITTTTI